MAYLKNWTDNFFQIFVKIFDFNGVNVAKHWHVAGEVFAISDCLVLLFFVILGFVSTKIL